MVTATEIILRGYQSALDSAWHLWYEEEGSLLRLCDGHDPLRAVPPGEGPNCRKCIDLYADSVVAGGRLRIEHEGIENWSDDL